MAKNPLMPKRKPKATFSRPEGAGNFDNMDDFNIVRTISLQQGTVQHTPTLDKDIVNKEYVDSADNLKLDLDGGNANQTIDIGGEIFVTTGLIRGGTIEANPIVDTETWSEVKINNNNINTNTGCRIVASQFSGAFPLGMIEFEETSSQDSSMFFYTADARTNILALTLDNSQNARIPNGNLMIGEDADATSVLTVSDNNPAITIRDNRTGISNGDAVGRLEWYTKDFSGGGNSVTVKIEAEASGSYAGADFDTDLVFYTRDNATIAEAMRISKTKALTVEGTIATANAAYFGRTSASPSGVAEQLLLYRDGEDVLFLLEEDAGTHEVRLRLRRGGFDNHILKDTTDDLKFLHESIEMLKLNKDGVFTFGGDADTDITMTFTGTTNSGQFIWKEDEDEFEFPDDIVFTGSGGLPFACMYVKDNSTTMTLNSAAKVQVTIFDTDGVSNKTTPDHTNDHITIVKAGMYMCHVNLSVENGAGAGHKIDVSVFKNNGATEFANVHSHRDLAAGTDLGSIALHGIIDLAVDDTIEVWMDTDRGSDSVITVEDITISLVMIGGT